MFDYKNDIYFSCFFNEVDSSNSITLNESQLSKFWRSFDLC